jgi:ectoine hydroxylase-related dioxygenase (phytanoyl-CoA dioxygenase family)
VNILSAITPIDGTNGGTLVLPGSHRLLSDAARSGKPVGKLPPCINVDAPAGCMVITHGQLLHGTGHNVSSEPRIVMLNVRSLSTCSPPFLCASDNQADETPACLTA